MVQSLNDVRDTLLDMANERDVDSLLRLTVRQLCQRENVALARIWLHAPGDICQRCPLRGECRDQSACLHLAASCGKPQQPNENWNRLDGRFGRIPMGVRKVGHVAEKMAAVEVRDISKGSHWIADPEWARRESIRGFIGQPIVHRDELLGVLGIFLRAPVVENALWSVRTVADHLASAIVNARAFEEIDRLRSRLASENAYLKTELNEARSHTGLIGDSMPLQATLEKAALVANTDTTVLLEGESGTGKELLAQTIHDKSDFCRGPLIRVNCASIPKELFESEFFGHVKGAFTGALQDRVGRFELAEQGTLFLDEIGEVPFEMQSKLLRVLQERTFERVGEATTRHANCRIIAATNKNLKSAVSEGTFREDLYYRLSVFPIELPPLRERPADIPMLVEHFLSLHCRRFGVQPPQLTANALACLRDYSWPGNVRELQNVVEQAALRLRVGPLEFHVPADTAGQGRGHETANSRSRELATLRTYAELKQLERDNLLTALQSCNWKIYGPRGAAERLEIHPATLTSKMKALGITRPDTKL